MSNNIDVVILAAGIGSRLQPLTNHKPKCMIDVGGSTILERILQQLGENDKVGTISVLTGHKHEVIANFVDKKYPKIQCIYNKDYLITNNMYSLNMFFSQRKDINNDLIVMNADCIYDDQVVNQCLDYKGSCIMTDSSTYLDESMKVKIDDQTVKGISKKFKQASDVYTSIDLYKFDQNTAVTLTNIVEDYIKNGDLNQWTEIAINDLVTDNSHIVMSNDIKGKRWFEIDTIEDLNQARELFS